MSALLVMSISKLHHWPNGFRESACEPCPLSEKFGYDMLCIPPVCTLSRMNAKASLKNCPYELKVSEESCGSHKKKEIW